jgi:hypothetical protein
MSETVPPTTEPSPKSCIVVKIIASYTGALEAISTTFADSLDPATLNTCYVNAIPLAHTLNSSENLTDQFTTSVTEAEDIALKSDATVTDCHTLTAQLI